MKSKMNLERRRKISAGMKQHIELDLPKCRCYVHRSKAEGISEETRAKIGAANSKALKGHRHSKEHKAAISKGLLGRKVSAETRQKISAAHKGLPRPAGSGHFTPHTKEAKAKIRAHGRVHAALDLPDCKCWIHTPNGNAVSKLSWKLVDFLVDAGFEIVIPEAQIGPYRIDALLAEEWIAFEADGKYWHDAKYDNGRDTKLLKQFKLPVVRLTEEEIKHW